MNLYKILLFILLLSLPLRADLIDEKIRSLVDSKSYIEHQKLIEIIFKNRAQFYITPDQLDNLKIVTALKENGLLDIFYKGDPKDLSATFRTVQSPNFLLKAIKDSLSDLGYNFTIISSIKREKLFFEWTISYKSDHAIDPALLAKRVASYGITIEDISKNGTDWFYTVSTNEPLLPEAIAPLEGESNTLLTPTGEYWISLPQSASKLTVRRKTGAIWFPYASFYDRNLKIISVVAYKEGSRTLNLKIPADAVYAKITDNYTTENLKHGIVLWIEGN